MDDEELRAFMRLQQQQIALQAEQLKELASLVRALAPTQQVVSPLTVSEVWLKYAAAMKTEMKPRSWMAINSRMKPVLKHFGDEIVAKLNPADEVTYRTKRLAMTTRRGTLVTRLGYANELGAFIGVLNWAVKADVLPENPLGKVRMKRIAKPRKTVYTEDDAEIILEAANDWLRAMILLCKEAGLRPIEILKLETQQIDRSTGFVHLRGDQTKNSKPRSVKLSARTLDAVKELPQGIKWVFTNPSTGNHWSYRTMNYWWHAVVKETGLEGAPGEIARFYDWRGTYATNMNRAGVSLPVIKESLGHSDYKQLEMYLRINQNDLAEGSARLEEHTRAQRRGPKRAPERLPPASHEENKSKGR